MSTLVGVGRRREREVGSLGFFAEFWSLAFVIGVTHVLLTSILVQLLPASTPAPLNPGYYSCVAGMSGVLFAWITLECLRSATPRRLLGCFTVPAVAYPFALLSFVALLLPGSSLYGHLSGVLVGFVAHRTNPLAGCAQFLCRTERRLPSRLTSLPLYHTHPSLGSLSAGLPVVAKPRGVSGVRGVASLAAQRDSLSPPSASPSPSSSPADRFPGRGRTLG
jgi:hypothetical protein